MDKILEINNLFVSINDYRILRDISFCLNKKDILAIIGESGSGKTLLAKTIMNFTNNATINGQIKFYGNNISYIFQDSMQALNPTMKIGDQIAESFIYKQKSSKKEAKKMTIELLKKFELPLKMYNYYPFMLSGGQAQRVLIAIAIASGSDLIICDEPTTALDIHTQNIVLDLLKSLNTSIIIISHDISIAKDFANKVAVMYAGEILEYAYSQDIFNSPKHPYTICLLNSIPEANNSNLEYIDGHIPDYSNLPVGDIFANRNKNAKKIDFEKKPPMINLGNEHYVKSWLYFKGDMNE